MFGRSLKDQVLPSGLTLHDSARLPSRTRVLGLLRTSVSPTRWVTASSPTPLVSHGFQSCLPMSGTPTTSRDVGVFVATGATAAGVHAAMDVASLVIAEIHMKLRLSRF